MKNILSPLAKIISKACLIVSLILLIACEKDDTSSSPTTLNSNITLLNHPQDPLILKIDKEVEGVIEYYGKRGNNGLPIKIDQIRHLKNDVESLSLNENNRIDYIKTFNGVQFYMDWQSDSQFILTAVTPDESFQINTPVNLNSSEVSAENYFNLPTTRTGKIKIKEINENQKKAYTKEQGQNNLNSYFTIAECGPFNTKNWVEVWSETGEYLRYIPTNKVAEGKFSYFVPSDISASVNPQELCKITGEVLDMVCELSTGMPGGIYLMGNAICTAITAAVATNWYRGSYSRLYIYCLRRISGRSRYIYCDVPVLSTLCDKFNFLNIKIYEHPEIKIVGGIDGIPQDIYTSPVTVSSQGPFPDLHLQLPATTKVNTLNLNPSAPQQDQDYEIIADMGCLTPGTVIILTVTENDEYYDEISYTISAAEINKEFILVVPGAEQGVRDVIQLEVKNIDGVSLTRTAVLVFQ